MVMAPSLFLAVIYTEKNGRLLIILIRDWSKDYLSLPCTLEMACSMLRFPLNQY